MEMSNLPLNKPATILVPEAHTRAGIAVIRSLGREGYNVIAVSYKKDALGLKSSYASQSILQPLYSESGYLTWLRNVIQEYDVAMIVPSSNIVLAIREYFAEFAHLLPLDRNAEKIFSCFLKSHVFRCFQQFESEGLLKNHPETRLVDDLHEFKLTNAPEDQGQGYFLKGELNRLESKQQSDQGALLHVVSRSELEPAVATLAADWEIVLVQSACTGYQVGVSVLMHNGQALVVNCIRDCYQEPHSNGTMSLRKTDWHEEIVQDAICRLRALGWQGCAMVEYRAESKGGAFWFIEINFRFWQYLHLDLYSGVNFPKYQAQWLLENEKEFTNFPEQNVICRDTWPGEVSYVVSRLKTVELSTWEKLKSVIQFFVLFFNWKVHSDLYFPGDKKLYFLGFASFIKTEFSHLAKRLSR